MCTADKRRFRIHKITCPESWPAVAARYYYAVGRSAQQWYISSRQRTHIHRWPLRRASRQQLVSLLHFLSCGIRNFPCKFGRHVTMKYASESILRSDVFLFATGVVKKVSNAPQLTKMAPTILLVDYPTALWCRKDKKHRGLSILIHFCICVAW